VRQAWGNNAGAGASSAAAVPMAGAGSGVGGVMGSRPSKQQLQQYQQQRDAGGTFSAAKCKDYAA
jgi:hypothetical protein